MNKPPSGRITRIGCVVRLYAKLFVAFCLVWPASPRRRLEKRRRCGRHGVFLPVRALPVLGGTSWFLYSHVYALLVCLLAKINWHGLHGGDAGIQGSSSQTSKLFVFAWHQTFL